MKLKPGQFVIIFNKTFKTQRVAEVRDISKSGRVYCRWIGHTKARGDFLTKTSAIDPLREEIIARATRIERDKLAARIRDFESGTAPIQAVRQARGALVHT